ncbi:serine--tRNA ligase [Algihabitans albus]|uniref:serine--tRNA ligase n=1 Tax=Algihabitans albus TaxID=2164067 RepID=UPI000E5D7F86|nr:serine--tRNA ligase [Algihabitans albus]
MHDLRWIREAPDDFDAAMARRALPPQSPRILDLDGRRRRAQTALQEMQARRNEASKEIGRKKRTGEPAEDLMAEVADLKNKMAAAEEDERGLGEDLDTLLAGLPNALAPEVPEGADESANKTLRIHGEKARFDFAPKEHFDIGEGLEGLDFEAAAKLSGARFVVLKGQVARLHRALAQFMLDLHTQEHGYLEVQPPLLVRDHVLFGTGQLPKFGEDQFRTEEGYWLIPTAEVPLTNLAAEAILNEAELPLRFAAHTPCFRSEAGAAGRDTRGMLRQHQFEKVELVSITLPERSEEEHERMTACAEEVLKRLGLHYRVVVLASGDTGFGARKTYDLEVWLPGQEAYREISSCSNTGDFQARRMRARFRPEGEKGTRFLHSLNGSGVAVGRALIAVLETYQQADGSVGVPEALQPYLGGQERIALA